MIHYFIWSTQPVEILQWHFLIRFSDYGLRTATFILSLPTFPYSKESSFSSPPPPPRRWRFARWLIWTAWAPCPFPDNAPSPCPLRSPSCLLSNPSSVENVFNVSMLFVTMWSECWLRFLVYCYYYWLTLFKIVGAKAHGMLLKPPFYTSLYSKKDVCAITRLKNVLIQKACFLHALYVFGLVSMPSACYP